MKFFLYIAILLLSIVSVTANEVEKIEILGNKRISAETIKVLGNFDLSTKFDANSYNNILKELYKTDFFEDIKIEYSNKTLKISVKENPIIEDIIITGIKK